MYTKINKAKKVEKLNRYMKTPDRDVYFLMFNSLHAMKSIHNYVEIIEDIKKIILETFEEECQIYFLGSRVIGLCDEDESDLDFFIDLGV